MRLYDNAPSSSYEELKTFYPVWYRDVLEMDALWRVFGNRLDGIQAGLVQAISNCYINTADEATIRRLEGFLYITYDGPRTLDERRALVASFFIGNGHIGEREIKEIVGAFTAGDISVSLADGGVIEISVTRELSDRFNLSDCFFIISKRIPAHLGIVFHDILLPIRFVNKERFIFEQIDFSSRFYNGGSSEPIFIEGRRLLDGTWKLDQMFRGILMPTFGVQATFTEKARLTTPRTSFFVETARNKTEYELKTLHFNTLFYNSGDVEPVFLDGRAALDGTWTLSQKFRGILFPRVSFKTSIISPEAARVGSLAFSAMGVTNYTRERLKAFRASTAATNDMQLGDTDAAFYIGAEQKFSMSASLVIDSMYELGGSVLLDGSRKLNANIIKEDI